MTPEPFESPPAQEQPKRTKRRSALCDSIVKAHPELADKADAALVAAHHRALFVVESNRHRQWREVFSDRRAEEFARRMQGLRDMTQRQAQRDLLQVGVDIDRANEIGAAVVGDELEYMAIQQTLNDRLFA